MCGGLHCYRYVPTNDTWVLSGNLSYSHFGPLVGGKYKGGVGFTYHDVLGLVVAGAGAGDGGRKVESTVDGETFQELRDLPDKHWGQCLVTLENGNLFHAGGYQKKYSRRYKPPPDDRWDTFNNRMNSDRNSRGCGKGPLTYDVRNYISHPQYLKPLRPPFQGSCSMRSEIDLHRKISR